MKKIMSLVEMSLLICMSFAIAYSIDKSSQGIDGRIGENENVRWLREKILGWLGENLVSAESLWTCPETNNGALCVEFPSSTCEQQCSVDCLPGRAQDFEQCKMGTCQDLGEGTCSANVPKSACENEGGRWSEDTPAECNPGCCLIGGEAQYVTEATCNTLSERSGIDGEFKEVDSEIECLLMGNDQAEGACVFEEEFENKCTFSTQAECLAKGGNFHEGLLCSNDELNTVCEKEASTGCVIGKEEVYWFDSCGNRENIYDSNRVRSWNNGRILSKNESCSLGVGSNDFANQATCGNCGYLQGSMCGIPGEEDKKPADGSYVCRDLRCEDRWGNTRDNGESWCAFDGKIGVDNIGDKNKERSADIPGSLHYREICINGEVRTEQCADFRNEICVESKNEESDFSSAACRVNGWQLCESANADKTKLGKCEENPDCFLKSVRISDFKFDVCAPKYPPGFDLRQDYGGEVGQTLCSMASQTCKQVWVKGFGGWKCKQNCDCSKPVFTETMNNLCMSLGDCGASVNVEEELGSGGYSVKGAPKLGQNYINGLREYANPEEGQKVDPLTQAETAAIFGLDPNDPELDSKLADAIGKLGLGATGVMFAQGAAFYGLGETIAIIQEFGISGVGEIISQGTYNLGAWGNLAGAGAAGAAMGYLIGKFFGLQGDALTLATLSGIAGGILAITGLGDFFTGFNLFTTGWFVVTLIIIAIVVIIVKLLGIGDSKIKKITFSCMPWQPPLGGNSCEKCGDNGLPCTKYKCQSLGQSCEFVNEGSSEEACVNSNPNDISAPVISPREEVISEGYEYGDVKPNGFAIRSKEQTCIQAYTPIQFGLGLNEVGQCKMDTLHTDSYEDMEFYFGENNLYKRNHTTIIMMPSLESLGVPEFDPNRQADFNLYVRCSDTAGNANTAEYNINFCVSPQDDKTPPIISHFSPESPHYLALNQTEQEVQFYINEPAECRFDTIDRDYDSMAFNAVCETDIGEMTSFGWPCLVNLTLPIGMNEKTSYFRCIDQPNSTEERNTNSQSVNYEIKRSIEELKIESLNPDEKTLSFGSEPAEVKLSLKTSGGAPGGADCEFNLGNGFIRFFKTGGEEHEQTFSALFSGDYHVDVRCTDKAGNTAGDKADFKVVVDDDGPEITRIYAEGTQLNVVTNEASNCYYDYSTCNFKIVNGTIMHGDGLVHSTSFDSTMSYYIKCQDPLGNVGSCSAVRAGY